MPVYTYAIGAGFFLVIWVMLYALLPGSRKALLWSGLAWGHAGPINAYWTLRDYWHPVYLYEIDLGAWRFGMEDYVFAFAFAGLCAAFFEWRLRRQGGAPPLRFNIYGFAVLLVMGFLSLVLLGLLSMTLELNSLYANVVPFLVGALGILSLRPAWWLPALQAAFLTAGLMWVFYAGFYIPLFPGIIDQWWRADALSGITLAGVPIEEVLWAWATGLFGGPALRLCLVDLPER